MKARSGEPNLRYSLPLSKNEGRLIRLGVNAKVDDTRRVAISSFIVDFGQICPLQRGEADCTLTSGPICQYSSRTSSTL